MNTIEKAIYEGLCAGLGVRESLAPVPAPSEREPGHCGTCGKPFVICCCPAVELRARSSGRAGDIILIHRDGDRFYADLPGEIPFRVVRSRRRDLVGKIRAMGFRVADACLTGG